MDHRKTLGVLAALSASLLTCCNLFARPADMSRIRHVIVIYAENRSFDNLYGLYPGANGIRQALDSGKSAQVDRDGSVLPKLPPTWDAQGKADPAYPQDLPNQPFQINAPPGMLPLGQATRDLVHRFYQNQMQIDGGKNDRFAAVSDAGGLTMGYYDGSPMEMWKIARQYTLADNFYMAAFGGSYLNHIWLACACTPLFSGAPDSLKAQVEPGGVTLKTKPTSPPSALQGPPQYLDGPLTPDGYAVNTMQPPYQPSGTAPAPGGDLALADPSKNPLPPQTLPTLGDHLSAKNVSWAWYSGGWNEALKDGMQDPGVKRSVIYAGTIQFQPHHQPYNYFANYAPGTAARAEHLKDASDFTAALKAGTLPTVSFFKPQGNLNQHPGYTDVMQGDAYVADLVRQIQASSIWKDTAIIVTYDENGGFWDHAAPPTGDRWGPGSRIPAIIISPFAKKGYVDHTVYDTTSVLKFITERFGLEPLPGIRKNVGDLSGAFDFTQRP